MRKPRAVKCSVQGCQRDAHARGYCYCHYGRAWRGKSLDGPVCRQEAPSSFNVQSLERQLADARRNHDLVVGIEGKMRWRHTIQDLEQRLGLNSSPDSHQSARHAAVAAG